MFIHQYSFLLLLLAFFISSSVINIEAVNAINDNPHVPTYELFYDPPPSEDTTPPVIDIGPGYIGVTINEDNEMEYTKPYMYDEDSELIHADCIPESGTLVASVSEVVENPIVCTATDEHNNTSEISFVALILENLSGLPYDPPVEEDETDTTEDDGPIIDKTAPILTVSIGNQYVTSSTITIEATDSATPLKIYPDSNDPSATISCTENFGRLINLDESVYIECTAVDKHENKDKISFTVYVRDTTAPVFSGMTDLTVSIDDLPVTFKLPNTYDVVDQNPSVWCSPNSGSYFEIGKTTTVQCWTRDYKNNETSETFTVTVLPGDDENSNSENTPVVSTPTEIDTNFGTLIVAKPSFIQRDAATKIIEISGNVENYKRGSVVEVKIIDPSGMLSHPGTSASGHGKYKIHFEIDNTKLDGVYTIEVIYEGNLVGISTFEPLQHYDKNITIQIPDWVRNTAKWWVNDLTSDADFIGGIEHMIKERIIEIDDLPTSTGTIDSKIPEWIKNTAKWWSEGRLSDEEFTQGIKYMVEHGIIRV